MALPFLVWALTACVAVPVAVTPQEAARQNITVASPESAASFQVLGMRQWERGVVVLYTYLRPAQGQQPPMRFFGYSLVIPVGQGTWRVTGGGASGTNFQPAAEELIYYSYGGGTSGERGNFSIVYGRSLAANVAAVEVTFDNGQVLRDEADDGVFALVTAARAAACELRVLDAQGQILKRIDTSSMASPSKEPGGPPMNNCPK